MTSSSQRHPTQSLVQTPYPGEEEEGSFDESYDSSLFYFHQPQQAQAQAQQQQAPPPRHHEETEMRVKDYLHGASGDKKERSNPMQMQMQMPAANPSWDSDGQFSSMEVQRMKSKANKLRASRDEQHHQHQHQHQHHQHQLENLENEEQKLPLEFDPDAYALAAAAQSAAPRVTKRTTASVATVAASQNPYPATRMWRDDAPSSRAESHNNSNTTHRNLDYIEQVCAEQQQASEASSQPSRTARQAQDKLMRNFHSPRGRSTRAGTTSSAARSPAKALNTTYNSLTSTNATTCSEEEETTFETSLADTTTAASAATTDSLRLALHDLCAEAVGIDDIAWRNAVSLLSAQPQLAVEQIPEQGWTALHVACLGQAPVFLIRALLYAAPQAARMKDHGGRLPLHLLAAAHAPAALLQVVVQEYPPAVWTTDAHGLTPLHVLLRNTAVELTVERLRIVLGWTVESENDNSSNNRNRNTQGQCSSAQGILQRRGQHLDLDTDALEKWRQRPRPVTYLHAHDTKHEAEFELYPADVRRSLRQLSSWKKGIRKLQAAEGTTEVTVEESVQESNPAAILEPETLRLPLHMLVNRAIVLKQPLEENEVSSSPPSIHGKEDDDNDKNNSSAKESQDGDSLAESTETRPSVPYVLESLRLLIAAHPPALLHRDATGYTPLLQSLQCEPSLTIVDFLLGKRSAGYETLPQWALDLPMTCSSRYQNPAMVSCQESEQLPLHMAAEEALSLEILQSVHDAYPGAVHLTDARGRTPLHLALSTYRRIPTHPQVVNMLFSSRVAHVRDDMGQLPLDWLRESAHHLPRVPPRDWLQPAEDGTTFAAVYQRFFRESLLCSSPSEDLLLRLRALPPWLRQQACAVASVQDALVEEVAKPFRCALTLLDGLVLVTLITVFRLQLKEHLDGITGTATTTNVDSFLPTWYTFCVYATASFRLLMQAVFWMLSIPVGEFRHLYLLNPWAWLDAGGMALTLVTSVFLTGGVLQQEDEQLLILGTTSTGLLWLALIGYLSKWWYGMAIFIGAFFKIIRSLVCPIAAAGALIVAGAQMFYTLLYLDCDNAIANASICSVRGSYRVVFAIMRGGSLVDLDGEEMTAETIVLLAFFLLLFAAFIVALLLLILMAAAALDAEQISLENFWEPKLALVMSSSNQDGNSESAETSSIKHTSLRLQQRDFYTILEELWDSLTLPWRRSWSKTDKKWYASSVRSRFGAIICGALAVFVIPLWLLVGGLTMGVLWPPQVRRWIFRPIAAVDGKQRADKQSSELSTLHLSEMRREILQFKLMSFEKSTDVEKELSQLRNLVQSAVKED